MITWEDFKNNIHKDIPSKYQITQIICPKCGKPLYRDQSIVLTTYPPQFSYVCLSCNWVGYC